MIFGAMLMITKERKFYDEGKQDVLLQGSSC